MKIMTNGLFLQIKSLSGNPNGFPDKQLFQNDLSGNPNGFPDILSYVESIPRILDEAVVGGKLGRRDREDQLVGRESLSFK